MLSGVCAQLRNFLTPDWQFPVSKKKRIVYFRHRTGDKTLNSLVRRQGRVSGGVENNPFSTLHTTEKMFADLTVFSSKKL